jgi:hypothetical protein
MAIVAFGRENGRLSKTKVSGKVLRPERHKNIKQKAG